jgi:hypothetical protein
MCLFSFGFSISNSSNDCPSRVASEDRLWRSMMQSHQDVPFRVYNMEKPIFEVWTRTPGSEPSIFNPPTGFMQPDRLLKMRSHVFARPLISPAALIGCGRTVVEEESEQRHLYHESLKSPKKKSDRRSNNKDNTPQSKATQWAKSGGGAETLQEAKRELSAVMKERDGVSNCPPSTPRADVASLTLLRTSCLVRVRVGSSCSTKLNYILNEVRSWHVCVVTIDSFKIFRSFNMALLKNFSYFPTPH